MKGHFYEGNTMTGRERILAVLERKPADRTPFDLGGTDCSSVHVLPYRELRNHFGIPDSPIICGCLTQLIAEFEKEMMDVLEVDAETLSFGSKETKVPLPSGGWMVTMLTFELRPGLNSQLPFYSTSGFYLMTNGLFHKGDR